MAVAAPDAPFEVIRVAALVQHFIIIIRFQKSRMAFAEMFGHILAGCADIRKYTHPDIIKRDRKAAWIGGIMIFRESRYQQVPDSYRTINGKRADPGFVKGQPAALQRGRRNIHRQLVLFCQDGDAADMIGMLMRNEYGLNLFDR